MKKIALVLTLALPFVFASCGDDDDVKNIELDNQTLSIDYSQVKSVGSNEKNCTYVSNNTFVATVDESGNVTGVHEGEAVITVTKEGFNPAQCVVTVKATNNNFELPLLTWNASEKEVTDNMETSYTLLENDKENQILTFGKSWEEDPWYLYKFDSDKLIASAISMDEKMDEDKDFIAGFLNQRYKYLSDDEAADFVFINADTKTSATLQINVVNNDGAITATWLPMEHETKAGVASEIAIQMHNHAKALRK